MPDHNNDPAQGAVPVHSKSAQTRSVLLLLVLIGLGVLLAYVPVLDGPLFFDDEPNLLDNTLVQLDGSQFDDWRRAVLSNDSGALHRPVAMMSFALNYFLAGEFSAFGLKAVNLFVHIANGLLVYCLAAAVLRSPAVSADRRWSPQQCLLVAIAAAGLWLLHPLHVSTVLYAVQRMAQLSTLFTLAAVVVFMRYRLRWATDGDGPGEVIAAALWLLVLALLAVLSKENGALLPWLLLVCEVCLFRGMWQGRERVVLKGGCWLLLVLPALGLALVALFAPEILPGSYRTREYNLEERVLTQGRALWLYLQWLAIPDITQMGFFHDDIPVSRSFWSPVSTGISVLAWVVLLAVCLTAYRKIPLLAFAVLFYLVGHSLESTVLPLELYFEHRNYLPSAGFAILLATKLMQFAQWTRSLRFASVMSGVFVLLTVLLVLRAQAWSDEQSLARHNVINHPDSPRANFYYALTLMEEFREVKASGGDPEREGALAVATRSYFMRMYELDQREIAGIVMLFQFDFQHFPAAAQRHDWLAVLESLAAERALHASDLGALRSLASFAKSTGDPVVLSRVEAILRALWQRFPYRDTLVEDIYGIHLARGGDKQEMLPLLEKTLAANKRSTRAAAHLVGYHAREDVPAAYDALREWMRRDTLRRELPVYEELLGQ